MFGLMGTESNYKTLANASPQDHWSKWEGTRREIMHSVYLCGGRERLDQLSWILSLMWDILCGKEVADALLLFKDMSPAGDVVE